MLGAYRTYVTSSASFIERILSNEKLSARKLFIKVQRSFLENVRLIELIFKKLLMS